jgi:hypothetical protein
MVSSTFVRLEAGPVLALIWKAARRGPRSGPAASCAGSMPEGPASLHPHVVGQNAIVRKGVAAIVPAVSSVRQQPETAFLKSTFASRRTPWVVLTGPGSSVAENLFGPSTVSFHRPRASLP